MSSLLAAGITLEGSNYTAVIVVALIAIAALGVAGDRKSTRLNSVTLESRMPSSA